MKTKQLTYTDWKKLIHKLGKDFEKRATSHDKNETFVANNYQKLKEYKLFSAAIPLELGGGNLSHT